MMRKLVGTILALTPGVGCATALSIDADLTSSCVPLHRRSDVTCSVARRIDEAGEPRNVRLSIWFDSGQTARENADLANRVVSGFCESAERTGESDADVVLGPLIPEAIDQDTWWWLGPGGREAIASEFRGTTEKGRRVSMSYIPCAARGRTPEEPGL